MHQHAPPFQAYVQQITGRAPVWLPWTGGTLLGYLEQRYVPALAMVGIPCVQGLRQWRANRLAHRWVRTFQRTIREEDMALQMARIRAWKDVPTFWLTSCPELQDSPHPRATMKA